MTNMYVMRRANGDVFTEESKGRVRIPVWSDTDAVARYKARNPELSVYLPTKLDGSLLKKISALEGGGATEFFLLSSNDPDADFNVGRPVMKEELFTESEAASRNAQLPV